MRHTYNILYEFLGIKYYYPLWPFHLKVCFSYLVDDRSNFAVAASITELLKDLPESLVEDGQRKGDSNRSSLEEAQQQVLY